MGLQVSFSLSNGSAAWWTQAAAPSMPPSSRAPTHAGHLYLLKQSSSGRASSEVMQHPTTAKGKRKAEGGDRRGRKGK